MRMGGTGIHLEHGLPFICDLDYRQELAGIGGRGRDHCSCRCIFLGIADKIPNESMIHFFLPSLSVSFYNYKI